MLQSPCKLGSSYSKATERVAQYVMRSATRGTHVYQYVVNVLKIGIWNIQTMLRGLDSMDIQNGELRKTMIIDEELARHRVDVAALQETRLPGCGSLRESDYTFYWQGLAEGLPRYHGVGFAIHNTLVGAKLTRWFG